MFKPKEKKPQPCCASSCCPPRLDVSADGWRSSAKDAKVYPAWEREGAGRTWCLALWHCLKLILEIRTKFAQLFLQKLFDTLLQHHMMMMLLLIFYVHLPLNLNAAVPYWCSHTIEPNVATRFPSKLRELVQVAAAHECARCRQTVRQSVRTTFKCFHCAQLGGKQATGTTATPSSANPLPTWKVVH